MSLVCDQKHVFMSYQHHYTPVEEASVVFVTTGGAEQGFLSPVAAAAPDRGTDQSQTIREKRQDCCLTKTYMTSICQTKGDDEGKKEQANNKSDHLRL